MDSNTIAAPGPAIQEGVRAMGPGDAAATAASRVDAVRRAHAASVANHRQAEERAERAAERHQQAVLQRQHIYDEAAAGQPTDQATIVRAKRAVAEAFNTADFARLTANGAKTLEDVAHVALLRAEAVHLEDVYTAAVQNRLKAAEAVDIAGAEFRRVVEAFNIAGFQISITGNAVRWHNEVEVSAGISNATLRALDPGCRPIGRQPVHIPVFPIAIPPLILIRDKTPEAQPVCVAILVRSQHGIPELDAVEVAARI